MANSLDIKGTTIHVGDTIDVHYKLIEKEKVAGKAKREVKVETRERTQIFEGTVIAIKGDHESRMITVRRIGIGNIGIERIIPAASPWIERVVVKKRGSVRRAKLYYLRHEIGSHASNLKEKAELQSLVEKPKRSTKGSK